ncbi:MAG: MBL fold metallo-hydrolase, partial [Gammaproteobacteria bacterium]|nr:MBL fold metallo-hydrolase [Gammaproteobacteria bacterium]
YPELQTLIPPGHASLVSSWDPVALNYVPSGQHCPRFKFDGLLLPGTEIQLADTAWQIHAAPGHDPHSVILFEPQSQTLISADALWEKGFGVVFPELEGDAAFDEVAATFDLIERLDPCWVIPGHGPVFRYRAEVLAYARARLNAFVKSPDRHAHHAVKVLLKFKLLDQQQLPFADFVDWVANTRYFQLIHQRFVPSVPIDRWMEQLTQELVRSAAARRAGDMVYNA